MTDKELRRLSRAELVDIIFELQKRCEECYGTIDKLQKKLDEKELRIANAGSIAEAAVQINGVLEAAQAAADQYLLSICAAEKAAQAKLAEADKQCAAMLASAQQKAADIIISAEQKAR